MSPSPLAGEGRERGLKRKGKKEKKRKIRNIE